MIKTIVLVVGGIALGAFGYWTISPLFIDKVADDPLPEIKVSPAEITTTPAASATSTMPIPRETAATPEAAPVVFPIVDTPTHPASGQVRVVTTPEEKIIRFENYNGTNGPDLKIYLAKDLGAKEYLSLGPARANQGNINYAVPMDVDISEYKYVLTWCEAFGVLFDYAEIN